MKKWNTKIILLFLASILCLTSCTKKSDSNDGSNSHIRYLYTQDVDPSDHDCAMTAIPTWTDKKKFQPKDAKWFELSDSDVALFKKKAANIIGSMSKYKLNHYFRQYLGYTIAGKKYLMIHFYAYVTEQYSEDCLCVISPNPHDTLIKNKAGNYNNGVMLFDYDSQKLIYSCFQ